MINLQVRNLVLYPAELRARIGIYVAPDSMNSGFGERPPLGNARHWGTPGYADLSPPVTMRLKTARFLGGRLSMYSRGI